MTLNYRSMSFSFIHRENTKLTLILKGKLTYVRGLGQNDPMVYGTNNASLHTMNLTAVHGVGSLGADSS